MKTISLCMIARDEEENLDRCLRSVRSHVDEIIVVDTGSRDRTREVARSHGARVEDFNEHTNPEAFFLDSEDVCKTFGAPGPFSGEVALGDFSAPRNRSFDLATGDYCFWLDCDDVLERADKLRQVVADLEARSVPIAFFAYDYARDAQGRVYYRQWRERVIKRGIGRWINPVHEVFLPSAPVVNIRFDEPFVAHHRRDDRKIVPNRNLKNLLRHAHLTKVHDPAAALDPRHLFYLGNECRFVDARRAMGFYEDYLRVSGWPEERAAAHIAMGSILEANAVGLPDVQQAYAKAELEYATAAAEMPDNPDGLLGLARIAYLRGRFLDCVIYSERGLKMGNPESMLGANPLDRTYRPHLFLNHALGNLGRLEEAIASCQAGLAACPEDPGYGGGAPGMLGNNLRFYQDELARRREAGAPANGITHEFSKTEDVDAPPQEGIPRDLLVIWSLQLWKQIVRLGDGARARAFLRSLPPTVAEDAVSSRMWAATARKLGGGDERPRIAESSDRGDVVFFLGAGPEPWDPRTPETKGLGGSETAAIEVAKNLAALGRRVVVYAEADGTFDGVEYRHHSRFTGASCEVFIASRVAWIIDYPISARVKLLWVHDIHCGPADVAMERRLLRFDRVLCLSKWHKDFVLSCYPTLPASKIIVTRNGIDPERFMPAGSRALTPKTNSLVFSSSPNRGLDTLLHNFQHAIRPAVPDAELHVFYGFDTWETLARLRGAQDELAEIARYKAMLPPVGSPPVNGVHFHGKRPQREVAAAYLRAKVWPYLTDFTETSCITAMEAQAAGCVPVCTNVAALPETVRHGVIVDADDPQAGVTFCKEVVRLLKDDDARIELARAGRKYALEELSWAALAHDWIVMFDRLVDEVADDPVPMWRSA